MPLLEFGKILSHATGISVLESNLGFNSEHYVILGLLPDNLIIHVLLILRPPENVICVTVSQNPS